MPTIKHEFEVTVSRINEGLHDPPYETHKALRVSVDEEGRLDIQGNGTGRSLSPGSWDSFEVKRITTVLKD